MLLKEPESVLITETITENSNSNEYELLKKKYADLQAENKRLLEENNKYKNDLISLQKVHSAMCRQYVKKDMKIHILQKKIIPGNVLFNSLDDIFGEDVLKELRKLAGSKKSDSTFILKCMRKLYSESEVLKSETASGTDGKSTVSPEKRKAIEGIFLERLSSENLNDIEINERFMRLNILINSSINNNLRRKASYHNIFFTVNSSFKQRF